MTSIHAYVFLLFFIELLIAFEEPWYTVFEGTPFALVCVSISQGTLDSDAHLTFNVRTMQATKYAAVGKNLSHTM